MGYRSDVTLVFYTLDREALPPATIKLWFDENFPHDPEWSPWINHSATEGYVLVEYHNVKWYSDYDHVVQVLKAIELFNDTFGTNESGTKAAFEMVEVGEELHHITHEGSNYCDYRLTVHREIKFN